MHGWSTPVKRGQLLLFWGVIAAVLIVSAGRDSAVPTGASHAGAARWSSANSWRSTTAARWTKTDPSDWIELWNRSNVSVDLRDWSLTDDPPGPTSGVSAPRCCRPTTGSSSSPRARTAPGSRPTTRRASPTRCTPTSGWTRRAAIWRSSRPPPAAIWTGRPSTIRRNSRRAALGAPPPATSCATTRPRPGASNDAAGTPVTLAAVTFSHARGLYDAPFALTLRTDDRTAAIRYTLDGSAPTGTHGTLYAEPISIDGTTVVCAVAVAPAAAPGPVATQTFIFPAAVMRQPAAPPGAPATWGTHRSTSAATVRRRGPGRLRHGPAHRRRSRLRAATA
ncbi:MAG: chitobiase/beta-hexosaminidase C-terminal domain-containing protein [Caldilineaceae bacterium]